MSKIIPAHNHGEIDVDNSTATPLGIGATFTGEWVDITEFGIIYINVYSDAASATDGLEIQQSSDGVNADHDDVFNIAAGSAKNFAINPYANYYRVVYTNGTVAQTAFRLQSKLNTNGLSSSHRIQDSISTDDDARLVKAVLTGEDPDGTFLNFQSTRQGNFKISVQEYGDTPAIDSFDRLRVSHPFTIFDSKQLYDKHPLFYDEDIGGSATSVHSTTHARTQMTVTATSGDYVIRQTKQRFNYSPGKSQLILCTFQGSQDTGCTKRIGAFDGTGTNYLTPNNGIFLEITESDITWNIAKAGTTTESVSQSNWNVDPLDGTGPSGVTFDPDGTHIIVIDFQWLGVGRVRCGICTAGIIIYTHYFVHDNDSTYNTVYMSTPNLPIRYDIQSDGTGTGYLDHICSSVMSEGGVEETGISRSVDTGSTHIDANTADTPYAMIGIRLKSTHLDLTVLPKYISMISETNDNFRWSLSLNPTYNGTLTWNDITNSGCQYTVGATANDVTDEGTKLDSGYGLSASSIDREIISSLRLGSTIDGTVDELFLICMPLASNADIQGSITFRELL